MLVLLIGGARSGKSDLAVRLAHQQTRPVVVIATAEAGDPEMAARIEQHRNERPGHWRTIEEPLMLRETIEQVPGDACLIVDCLTLWAANVLDASGVGESLAQSAAAAQAAQARPGLTLIVSNEVGLGVVPDRSLGRVYRDLLGRINTIWADHADRAYLLVAGRALPLESADALLSDLD
jgi:adenosyl cobinamide kinase/adenosyl cobinamide phosphate guanylyltransferase